MLRSFLLKTTPYPALGLFLLLALPIIYSPYQGDDYFHQLILQGLLPFSVATPGSLWGMFSFVQESAQNHEQMMLYGALPWWVGDKLHFVFWRPLAEVSLWLDHYIAPGLPVWAKLHNVAWFVALALLLHALFKRLGANKLSSALAFTIFIFSSHHAGTIELIANRNAIMSAFFGFLALWWHVDFRQTGQWRYLGVALFALLLSAASGETAFTLGGFFLAYAVILDKAGAKQGFVAILPYGFLMLAWLGVYRYLGYGAGGSEIMYLDPFNAPVLFAQSLFERWLALAFSGLGIVPAEALVVSQALGDRVFWLYVSAVLAAIALLAFLLRSLKNHKLLQFSILAALIALLPMCTVIPQSRLLLVANAGFCLFIALVIYEAFLAREKAAFAVRCVAGVFVLLHLLLSPVLFFKFSTDLSASSIQLKNRVLAVDDALVQNKVLVVSHTSLTESALFTPIRLLNQRALPKQVLYLGSGDLQIQQQADGQYLISSQKVFLGRIAKAFRDFNVQPLQQGERVSSGELQLTVLELSSTSEVSLLTLSAPSDDVVFLSKKQGAFVVLEKL